MAFKGHTDLVHCLDWQQDSSVITSGSQVTPAPFHVANCTTFQHSRLCQSQESNVPLHYHQDIRAAVFQNPCASTNLMQACQGHC